MFKIIDFGLKDYNEILEKQSTLFHNLLEEKKEDKEENEYLLIGEHYPVYTMGRRAKEENLLISEEILNKRGVKLYHIGRGGDITYHCPGQIIMYPIIDLDQHKLSVKEYVNLLEETVILLLSNHGIKGERIEGATGVWIGKGTTKERKICAIGIKCTRFCAMHGLALNVTSDLRGFTLINPCGFQDKGVTSIAKEKGEGIKAPDISEIKKELSHIFLSLIFSFKKVLDFPEQL